MITTVKKMLRISSLASRDIVSSLLVFVLKAAGGLLGYLLFALIARFSGPEEFGKFSVLFSIVMLIGTAGSLGQQVFLVKEIPIAQHKKDTRLEQSAYVFSFFVTLVGGAAAAMFFIGVAAWLLPQNSLALISGGIFCFTFAVSQTTVGALRIQNRIVYATATRDVLWRILTAIVVVILPMTLIPVTADVAIFAMGLSLLIVVTWHLAVIIPKIKLESLSVSREKTKAWLKLTSALSIAALISSADLYIYSITIGFTKSASEVGAFFASLKTVEVINLFLMSVSLVVGPRIARAVAGGATDVIQSECNFAILIQGIPAILACSVVLAIGPILLGLFDPSFVAQAAVLKVLAIGVIFNALSGSTGLLMQLLGLHWHQVVFQGMALVIGLILLPLTVARAGIVGAAICYVVSKVLWNVLAIWAIRRRSRVDPSVMGLLGTGALSFRGSMSKLKDSLGMP